jgi:predicted Rossmann fold flavoprotein
LDWKAESRKQKAESRKQKAESRKQKAESRKQKAESRKQKAESRKHNILSRSYSCRSAAVTLRSNVGGRRFLPSAFCFLISSTLGRVERIDIAIVGAGAAGLMAAIFAGRESAASGAALRVVALDSAARIGAKILISGGGRCNVTHDVVRPEDFNGNRNQIAKVLRSFSVSETVAFFEDLGVPLKREEGGKLFPQTDRARTVVDALTAAAEKAGVELRTGWRIERIAAKADHFVVTPSDGAAVEARVVVLATGGRSVPRTGSDGHGYAIATKVGHTIAPTFPALVPLVVESGHWMRKLSGVTTDVELAVRSSEGRILHRQRGSLLFTHFGISGPAPLDISRHWIASRRDDGGAGLTVSFAPGEGEGVVEKALAAAATESPRAHAASVLRRWVPERLAVALVESAGMAPTTASGQVTRDGRRMLVDAFLRLHLPIVADRGFDYAEVTAGGVPMAEVRTSTMESRQTPRLFLCGEILDVDGRIGGYNFQWAWATGRLAGTHATRRCVEALRHGSPAGTDGAS